MSDGSDEFREEMLRCAADFKKSWVKMAEALRRVQSDESYLRWGYEDLYAYCSKELRLRRSTVDKLTLSYGALKQHAPHILRTEAPREIPSVDSVDYFAKALTERSDLDPQEPNSSAAELQHAVFEDLKPVASLKRAYDPVFFPKTTEQRELDVLEKTGSVSRRLALLLRNADTLDPDVREETLLALQRLDDDLKKTILPLRGHGKDPERATGTA